MIFWLIWSLSYCSYPRMGMILFNIKAFHFVDLVYYVPFDDGCAKLQTQCKVCFMSKGYTIKDIVDIKGPSLNLCRSMYALSLWTRNPLQQVTEDALRHGGPFRNTAPRRHFLLIRNHNNGQFVHASGDPFENWELQINDWTQVSNTSTWFLKLMPTPPSTTKLRPYEISQLHRSWKTVTDIIIGKSTITFGHTNYWAKLWFVCPNKWYLMIFFQCSNCYDLWIPHWVLILYFTS